MQLPILERTFALAGVTKDALTAPIDVPLASLCGSGTDARVPALPEAGEQYRFHFDMAKCIGCKCCVVACNEQNGNPADILWRRVGEIEGGTYPNTRRYYLSMGCNHCLEPTCLKGCPVDAYNKDSVTGIVRHNAEACIGCQYCTWNCSYGVPQYNAERGVVGKCDMCYGRLTMGQAPACVAACPEEAIRIEVVKTEQWRSAYRTEANAPGMPSAEDSVSSTRITLPEHMPAGIGKVTLDWLKPEHAHWPLVFMTVLTQLSVGAFTTIAVLQAFLGTAHRVAAWMALAVAAVALMASTLHLGRPIHAIRALRMWRRSWLSREVLAFTVFAHCAAAFSAWDWFILPHATALGMLTAIVGMCGVLASARLYLAPGRPAWNSPFTIAEFLCATAVLGAAGANVLTMAAGPAVKTLLAAVAVELAVGIGKLIWLLRSRRHELRGAAHLLLTDLENLLFLRWAATLAGAALLLIAPSRTAAIVSAVLLICSEFVGRYLFFVSVVPSNMATEYLHTEAA